MILLICILIPSLYSLVNIFASWDPYSSTSGILVAVVNEDKGTVFKDQDINLGNELVDKLKDNDKIGWKFVDKETADNGLLMEDYYASIIIPEDFSKKTTTLVEKNIEKPKLIYTVNEKKNPIAPKFTDSAVGTVKAQLDENIKKTISGIIFRMCEEVGITIEDNRSELRRIMDGIYELDDNMPKLESLLDSTVNGTISTSEFMSEIQKIIPFTEDIFDGTNSFIDDNLSELDDIQSELDELSPDVKEKLVSLEKELDNLNVTLGNLDDNILSETAKKTLLTVSDTVDAMQTKTQSIRDQLKDLSRLFNKISKIDIPKINIDENLGIDDNIKNLLNQYNKQVEALESIQENLKEMSKTISVISERLDTIDEKLGIVNGRVKDKINDLDNGEKLDIQFLTDIKTLVNDSHNLVADIIDDYSTDILKNINSEIDSIRNIGDDSSTLIGQIKAILPDIYNITNTFMDISNRTHDELVNLQRDFPDIQDKVHKLATKIKQFDDEEDIDEVLELITNDWKAQSDFVANPVEIQDNRMFPWPNYGSTATPFYTVLCLWIGGYMLSMLLGTEVHAHEDEEEYKSYEVYFGRMALFVFIGIFQAIVASLGALYILKVYAVHPVIFVFFSVFVSIVFMIIIYTAVSLFGHGGIVIGIVLLVIQVAASSANFPIEVNPRIFQIIYPFIPFTYAINGMRQIMAGIVYSILFRDIFILSIYMLVSIILGTTFKKTSNKIIKPFIDKLKESKLVI